MIPRHSPRALSSLTYTNFFTRLKYSTHGCFPYSVGNVRRTLSLPGCPGLCVRGSHSRPLVSMRRIDSRGPMCVPWCAAGGTRSRLVKEIGLITQAERRSVIRTIRYSIARFRFLIRRRVLVSYLLRPCLSLAPQCTAAACVPASRVVVEPRRLELLTPSLQRRCSPN